MVEIWRLNFFLVESINICFIYYNFLFFCALKTVKILGWRAPLRLIKSPHYICRGKISLSEKKKKIRRIRIKKGKNLRVRQWKKRRIKRREKDNLFIERIGKKISVFCTTDLLYLSHLAKLIFMFISWQFSLLNIDKWT